MMYCNKCGTRLEDGTKVCTNCKAVLEQPNATKDYGARLQELNQTADSTMEFDPEDIRQNKTLAVVAYLGILVLIPMFAAKESKFARYHTNQGLVLFLLEIAFAAVYNVLTSIFLAISWRLYFLGSMLSLVWLVFMVVSIIGIINASKGRAKELPMIGQIRILK